VAVGDNLLHMPIVDWCKTEEGYDFTPLYREVKELLAGADMAFVNQEAPLGGEGFAPSGYPMFNSPQQAGLALAATGFNVINQANNHALDKGAKAVLATADFWQEIPDVKFIGINRSEEERAEIRVTEAQGYRFAWLAYSYGTNGMPMAYSYLLNLIDKEAMAREIEQAHELADAVIVSLHWGNEYQLKPSPQQRDLARFLADQGVTLVIGHHPHVVQPLEWQEGANGRSTLVMYSLGNFVSNQSQRNTMLEGMLSVVFIANEDGVVIEDCGVIPLVMHYERGYLSYCVYPLFAYTDDLARRHYINQLDKPVSMDFFDSLAREIWGEYCILENRR
jgi:poly-gamma-glutamate synthesis protein (capsule biosynthesis protein)